MSASAYDSDASVTILSHRVMAHEYKQHKQQEVKDKHDKQDQQHYGPVRHARVSAPLVGIESGRRMRHRSLRSHSRSRSPASSSIRMRRSSPPSRSRSPRRDSYTTVSSSTMRSSSFGSCVYGLLCPSAGVALSLEGHEVKKLLMQHEYNQSHDGEEKKEEKIEWAVREVDSKHSHWLKCAVIDGRCIMNVRKERPVIVLRTRREPDSVTSPPPSPCSCEIIEASGQRCICPVAVGHYNTAHVDWSQCETIREDDIDPRYIVNGYVWIRVALVQVYSA